MMMDFTRVLTEYINNDVVLNTLVVMELAGVYETPCDDCRRLADEIGNHVPSATTEQREQFAALVRSREPESIERLFERVETMPAPNIYASGLPTYFRYAVNQVFSGIGWDLRLGVLDSFLRKRLESDATDHVFVSFNYDLALDKCIESATDGSWQPRDGYGFEFPFYVVGNAASEHPGYAAAGRSCVGLPSSTKRFRLIKPHGSLNFLVPQRASGLFEPAKMLLPLTSDLKLRYWPSALTFNYVVRPDDWPRDVKILIAPPSPQKPEVLRQAVSDEFDAIESADEVFILGYSLPKTDTDQRDLIGKAVKERRTQIERLTIVNRNAPDDYFEDVTELFDPQETPQRFNNGFFDFAQGGGQ
jgi:hypothetical protein